MKYIDKDELIKTLQKPPVWTGLDAIARINAIPCIELDDYVPKDFHDKTCEAMAKRHQEEIADMVRVVRCKECKWASPNKEGDYDCKCHIPIFRVDAEGYCYLADRKESE